MQEGAQGVSSEVVVKSGVSVVLRFDGDETVDVTGKPVDTDRWCSVILAEPYVEGTSFVFGDCASDAIPSVVVGGIVVPRDSSVYDNDVVSEFSVTIKRHLLAWSVIIRNLLFTCQEIHYCLVSNINYRK